MRDEDKTKKQLIYELSESRKHNTQLKEREVFLNQTIATLLKSNKRYQLLYENDIIELKQMEQELERDYELRTSNEQLQLDIIERKRAEEVLLRQHEQLLEQLSFVSAMNLIAGKIINNDNTYNILETMAEIVGSTLRVDRSKIYDIDFVKHLVIGPELKHDIFHRQAIFNIMPNQSIHSETMSHYTKLKPSPRTTL